MNEQVFRFTVVMLLGILVGAMFATGTAIGTINGTVEYLAMKARQR